MLLLDIQGTELHDTLASVLAAYYPVNKFIQLSQKLVGTFYWNPFKYVPLHKCIQCLDISSL